MAQKAKTITNTKEFQDKLYGEINGSAPRVDRCTGKYVDVYPERRGIVSVSLDLTPYGKAQNVKVRTSLKGQDNLLGCIKDVIRRWQFPKVEHNKVDLAFQIPVAEGAKFRLLRPGEKPPPRPKGKKAPPSSGFLRLGLPDWGGKK